LEQVKGISPFLLMTATTDELAVQIKRMVDDGNFRVEDSDLQRLRVTVVVAFRLSSCKSAPLVQT